MMRCMTAIWPAGPPKLSIATRAQTRKASARLAPCRAVSWRPDALVAVDASVMSGSWFSHRPVMGLIRRVPTPAIEGIIQGQAGFELFEVLGVHPRQSERGRQQARGFGN